MNLPQSAIEVLLSAERQLVLLAYEAGEARDYDAATALLEAARKVKMLGTNGVPIASSTLEGSVGTNVAAAPDALRPIKRLRKDEYPKFFRDDDSLLKIGWSKTEKAEYEHKSPKRVLQILATALAETGTKGRRFTMDKVLPVVDPADSTSLPDYQCYLCLAWLRHEELVIQHGRQGYSLPKSADLVTAIERAWEQLPVRG